MFKTQVELWAIGERFKCKVLNILTSFLWWIRVQTIENCCRFVIYNNVDSFWRLSPLKALARKRKTIAPPSRHFHGQHSYWPQFSTNQRARNRSGKKRFPMTSRPPYWYPKTIKRWPCWKSSFNTNDREQVLWAHETEHSTQTPVFTKTAGRHYLA